ANFSFPTRAAQAPIERSPQKGQASDGRAAGAREVIMFSTQGCGYCTKARKFLTANKIPFTELDVEEDPAASSRLQTLGQKAGLGARDLQGVPILFIDGKPLIGWDERQASRLLGLSG
ncbi:MAG TPA: glutaredoxin domain-containing protein, partial [Myxococcota bacterium]|nr:glutaredoxin domain-containing protein [Myxococcota bacterium]